MLKNLLLRVIYVVVLVVVVTVLVPLLFELLGLSLPVGPAILILKFAFACLMLVYVFFGPTPPSPF